VADGGSVDDAIAVDDADAELDTTRLERLFGGFDTLSRLIVTSNRPELWRFAGGLEPVDVRGLSRGLETGFGTTT